MQTEKTIQICGKDVKLRYCAAAETGYEKLSDKSIGDLQFNMQEDMLNLALACIVAAYERNNETALIDSGTLLYDASPKEIIALFTTVLELRAEWYGLPKVVADELKAEAESVSGDSSPEKENDPKNAPTPTDSTN